MSIMQLAEGYLFLHFSTKPAVWFGLTVTRAVLFRVVANDYGAWFNMPADDV